MLLACLVVHEVVVYCSSTYSFADVFDAKMEEKQQKAKETKEREFAELKER